MNARRLLLSVLFLMLILFATGDTILADPPQTAFDLFQKQLAEARGVFDKWTLNGNVIVALTIIIGLLGAISGWLHQRDDKAKVEGISVKWKVAVGLCVTLLTIVNTTLFEADYRTYWRLADEGHDLAWKIDIDLASYHTASDEDRQEFFQSIQDNFAAIQELKRSLHEKKGSSSVSANQSGGLFTNVALASERGSKPSWVNRLPRDYNNIYCVGVDYDNSIKLASAASLEDAKRNCMSYLIVLFETMASSTSPRARYQEAASFIVSTKARSVRVADTFYEYDQASRRYVYYTLLQIQRELARNDIAFFNEMKQQTSMETIPLADLIMKAPPLPSDFYWRRDVEFRKNSPVPVRLTDMQKRLWYAIGLRKEGNLKKASQEFMYIAKRDTTALEAWYNLALSAEGQDDSLGAARAYSVGMRIAALKKVEHPYLIRDYGLWLYKHTSERIALEYLARVTRLDVAKQGM